MRIKKGIYVIGIVIVIWSLFSSVSLALSFRIGTESASQSVDWKNDLAYDMNSINYTYQTVEISVAESGIYNFSTSYSGGEEIQFMIGKKTDKTAGNGIGVIVSALPVATYEGQSEAEVHIQNNYDTRCANVFLRKGETYYISFATENGIPLDPGMMESGYLEINSKCITTDVDKIYETNIASTDFTTKTRFDPLGTIDGINCIYSDEIIKDAELEKAEEEKSGDEKNAADEYKEVLEESLKQQREEAISQEEQNSGSAFGKVISWFVVTLGDGARWCINKILGVNSIDDILFNRFSYTALSIFKEEREKNPNQFLEQSGMLDQGDNKGIMTEYYNFFRGIAVIIYLVMLLYMGIRILLGSTGKQKEKYKSMLTDWLKGVLLLFAFPYVMKWCITINNAIVSYVDEMNTGTLNNAGYSNAGGFSLNAAQALGVAGSSSATGGDIMLEMRLQALEGGNIVYALIYLLLIKQIIAFVFIYFKRLLIVIFLIMIFPLVVISYAYDKIADGKSQAFNKWFSEFVLNVFLQTFQVINYVLIMSIITRLSEGAGRVNVILMILAVDFISKGDELLRSMFSKMSGGGANTVIPISEAVKTVATVNVAKSIGQQVLSVGGRISNLVSKVDNVKESYNTLQEAKVKRIEDRNLHAELLARQSKRENISTNIGVVMGTTTGVTNDDKMEALNLLVEAKNSSALHANYEAALSALSPDDRAKLEELIRNKELINGLLADINRPANMKHLTKHEFNIAMKAVVKIIEEGSTGDCASLYEFMDSKNLVDSSGHITGSVMNGFIEMSEGHVLDDAQQNQMKSVEQLMGDDVELDCSKCGENRVKRDARGTQRKQSYGSTRSASETSRATALCATHSTAGGNRRFEEEEKRVARAVARLERYQADIRSGRTTPDGRGYALSTQETYDIVRTLQSALSSTNNGTKAILEELHASGFDAKQFVARAAVATVKDYTSLDGTDEEIQDKIDWGYRTLQDIENENLTTILDADERRAAATAKAIVNRAEVDDITLGERERGTRPVDDGYTTQEMLRDEREMERARVELGHDYDNPEIGVGEARARFALNMTELVGATASVPATVVSYSTGLTAGALEAGMSGKMDAKDIAAAGDMGMNLEEKMESLVSGTYGAENQKNSFGASTSGKVSRLTQERLGQTADAKREKVELKGFEDYGTRGEIKQANKNIR